MKAKRRVKQDPLREKLVKFTKDHSRVYDVDYQLIRMRDDAQQIIDHTPRPQFKKPKYHKDERGHIVWDEPHHKERDETGRVRLVLDKPATWTMPPEVKDARYIVDLVGKIQTLIADGDVPAVAGHVIQCERHYQHMMATLNEAPSKYGMEKMTKWRGHWVKVTPESKPGKLLEIVGTRDKVAIKEIMKRIYPDDVPEKSAPEKLVKNWIQLLKNPLDEAACSYRLRTCDGYVLVVEKVSEF